MQSLKTWMVLCGLYFTSMTVQALDVFVRQQSLQQVLPQLAAELGTSVVIDPNIDADITLSIRDANWQQILSAVAQQLTLSLSWQDEIAILTQRQEGSLASMKSESSDEECADRIWHLKHAKAGLVGEHVKQFFTGIRVIVDARTNAIMTHYCGTEEVLGSAIVWLDSPMRQIEIAAEIAQVSDSVQEQLGVNWQARLVDQVDSGLISNVDLGIASAPISVGLSGVSGNLNLSATLDWLERNGSANIIARPKIVTSEGQPARIESGTEVPYQVMDDENLSVEFRQAGLVLEVTPEVKDATTLLLNLKIHQDSVGDMVNGVPSLETNRVQTQVEVSSGETLVLGGIFREEKLVTVSKVPVLGDVPLLGALFRQRTEQQEKRELLVFITPKLLKMSVN
ncbi:Type IV pilus biogenesis and competence protein PilQ precursor [Marinomonas gallaica]|uniref:Type IV pilus biogenesis and competence protein PilQ n=1 Tax=Marinomonas gallaica TaxID=1806667 RepID=A0A1C3JLD7_9GAMM|nr:type II and III secretion system protein [Marinomonas gallaica]SBT15984.1 Type IV pilus biogenesis and competence protein PilQ precursor [Marinomonas gallaica]SBT21032.1 Type IV pilus biogenesis and competence protein PilQ precursor [Marinomonas gallaica]